MGYQMKLIIVLTTGVTIEIHSEDTFSLNGKKQALSTMAKELTSGQGHFTIKHFVKKEKINVTYYLNSEKVSWCYVQEVKKDA